MIYFLFLFFAVNSKLVGNAFGNAQEMKRTTSVCDDRSDFCSVLLDVPAKCAGETSNCPIGFFYHGHGGRNADFARNGAGKLVHNET